MWKISETGCTKWLFVQKQKIGFQVHTALSLLQELSSFWIYVALELTFQRQSKAQLMVVFEEV